MRRAEIENLHRLIALFFQTAPDNLPREFTPAELTALQRANIYHPQPADQAAQDHAYEVAQGVA